jgi:hypothetical protein
LGKWLKWLVWGITYPILGVLVSTILAFFTISTLWTTFQPQLAAFHINESMFAMIGTVGLVLFFIMTVITSIIFWLVAGVVSIFTTPMLKRMKLASLTNFIFVPWLFLSIIILVFTLFIESTTVAITNFAISVVVNYIGIWGSVWFNRLFKMQGYLPS